MAFLAFNKTKINKKLTHYKKFILEELNKIIFAQNLHVSALQGWRVQSAEISSRPARGSGRD